MNCEDYEDPFANYSISDKWRMLNDVKGRILCPSCNKSRKFFCYTCYIPLPQIRDIIPQVSLPIKVDIVKHSDEVAGKSTSPHAAILAPKHVTVYEFPKDFPVDIEDGRTIFVYPNNNCSTVEEYFKANPVIVSSKDDQKDPSNNFGKIFVDDKVLQLPFDRAIFIDGTWSQSKSVYRPLKELPCIILPNRPTLFWRHQKGSPRWFLATVEAIHELINQVHKEAFKSIDKSSAESKTQEYDNLLFFFRYMYDLIHQHYDHDELLSYRRPMNVTYKKKTTNEKISQSKNV